MVIFCNRVINSWQHEIRSHKNVRVSEINMDKNHRQFIDQRERHKIKKKKKKT